GALEKIQSKHTALPITCARPIDKAKIWAALTGYFGKCKIPSFASKFQKNILIALNARNPNFGIYSVVFCYQDDKEELKDCDELWKLSSQNKNTLFWSMGICYSLLKTTDVTNCLHMKVL
ncbi:hypothetical protein RFI_16152, partial [Reticulomyxa filosa]